MTTSLDPKSGDYFVARDQSDWRFSGSIGRTAVRADAKVGRDALGDFNEIIFDWVDDGPKTGEIRAYVGRGLPLVQFILTCHSPHAPLRAGRAAPQQS